MRDLTNEINIEEQRRLKPEGYERTWVGGFCEFFRPPILEEIYGRKNLGLKVFVRAWERCHEININELWTEDKIHETAMIYNILAFRGLAPRVYDVVRVGKYYALVTEFLEGDAGFVNQEEGEKTFKYISAEIDKLGIVNVEQGDRADNYINGKIIDLNLCYFKDFEGYKKKILQKLQDTQEVGAGGFQAYQIFENLPGKRNTKYRVEKLKMNEDDFGGRVVLDLGCSVGVFCQEASKRGARRVFGLDYEHVCQTAREWANLNGYYNIDFIGMELCREPEQVYADIVKTTGYNKFDIIFFLSMARWMGIHPWIYNSFNQVLYCEEHPGEHQIKIPKNLKTIELGKLELEPWDSDRRILKVYL